jgi:hypothetical protein
MDHAQVMIMPNSRCSVDPLSGMAAGHRAIEGGAGMTAAESKTHPAQPKAKRAAAHTTISRLAINWLRVSEAG